MILCSYLLHSYELTKREYYIIQIRFHFFNLSKIEKALYDKQLKKKFHVKAFPYFFDPVITFLYLKVLV